MSPPPHAVAVPLFSQLLHGSRGRLTGQIAVMLQLWTLGIPCGDILIVAVVLCGSCSDFRPVQRLSIRSRRRQQLNPKFFSRGSRYRARRTPAFHVAVVVVRRLNKSLLSSNRSW